MISLSSPTFDMAGTLLLRTRVENPYSTQRRGSVTATLDGGVSVYDTGFSEADQVLQATMKNPTKDTLIVLRYLIAYYPQLNCSCESGYYSVVATSALKQQTLTLTFRVIARLDS